MIPRLPLYRKQLDNGLKIIVIPDNRLPVLTQYTFYKVGSRNESTNITGISHLFEHMMYNGSRNFGPGEFDRILESHGGYSNAYTSHDMTVYYESFPTHILDLAMELNADRMGWLDLNPESLESEREVVKEERRMRTENSVTGILEEQLFSTAFAAHPYRWPVIGWMDDIKQITLKDCQAYYNSYYVPNNALLIFAGNCNPQQVFSMAEKHYGVIPSRSVPVGRFTKEPEQRGERRSIYYKKTELESCMFGYHVPGVESEDKFALDMMQLILGEGESSRLYQRLVYEREIAVDVHVDYEWHLAPTLFTFYAQLNPRKKVAEVEAIIEEELSKIDHDGPMSEELEKAAAVINSAFIRGLKTANGRANRMGIIELLVGDCERIYELLDKYNKVSREDIRLLVEKYFNKKNCTVVSVLPEV